MALSLDALSVVVENMCARVAHAVDVDPVSRLERRFPPQLADSWIHAAVVIGSLSRSLRSRFQVWRRNDAFVLKAPCVMRHTLENIAVEDALGNAAALMDWYSYFNDPRLYDPDAGAQIVLGLACRFDADSPYCAMEEKWSIRRPLLWTELDKSVAASLPTRRLEVFASGTDAPGGLISCLQARRIDGRTLEALTVARELKAAGKTALAGTSLGECESLADFVKTGLEWIGGELAQGSSSDSFLEHELLRPDLAEVLGAPRTHTGRASARHRGSTLLRLLRLRTIALHNCVH